MKKVLVLATYFPPAGGISTFRVTKFVKYLGEFGWKPVVVTISEKSYNECQVLMDNSLLTDLPEDLSIHRTNVSNINKLIKDPSIKWLYPLFSGIKKIIEKEKPNLLFATGDPFFPLLVAPFVKRFYGVEYIIDLRDPWKLAARENTFKARLRRPLNNLLEPIVINNAKKVIVVSEIMAQQYRDAYPKREATDFIVIPNGFDPDDFDPIPAVTFKEFTIVYAGKFLAESSFRNPIYFLQALKILQKRNLRICFKHIGQMNSHLVNLVDEIGLVDQFESVGQLSYYDTISYMKGANALLLIGSGAETEQTGKIFDYLGCKRPILALASKKGGIADVVNDLDEITLMENEDPIKIADAIYKIYLTQSNLPIERANISKYLRRNLTSELSEVFNQ